MIDSSPSWFTGVLTFLLALIGYSVKVERKRYDDTIKENAANNIILGDRITRLESTSVTDKDVRATLKEYLDPILLMQKDIGEIKLQMASIPKRKED